MAPHLLVSSMVLEMVMRVILLFLQREKRRLDMVPKEGPSNNSREEESRRRT
jgi:hypothetical protein